MSSFRSGKGAEPRIDLETVRETLQYMQADMRNSARLAGVSEALGRVLAEIDAVAGHAKTEPARSNPDSVVPFRAYHPKFVPWSAG